MTRAETGRFFIELKDAREAANDYIRANAWRSIAVAGGIAFVVGLLLGRRR